MPILAMQHAIHTTHHLRQGLTLSAVFGLCLVTGLVLTAIFAALGALGGAFGGTGSLQVGSTAGHRMGNSPLGEGAAPPAGPALLDPDAPLPRARHIRGTGLVDWALSWLSPLSIGAGSAWFGGGGLIGDLVFRPLALPLALASGLGGAWMVRGLLGMLQHSSTQPLQIGADGAIGRLNAAIRADASGEVIYTLEGLRRSAPARSVDGRPLPRGTRVVIVRRERGVAWVMSLDPLD